MDDSASFRDIARQYAVSKDALARHKREHLAPRLAQVVERNEQADIRTAIDVVAQLKAINGAALSVLTEARNAGDGDLALRAIDRIQRQVELQAKLIDLINDGDTVNIIIAPEWVQLRTVILAALHPYPDAAQAVAGRLVAIEGGRSHAAD
ncbi:MAG: hypothetical protein ACR2OE_16460 [Thermomicrobiales bacterium]